MASWAEKQQAWTERRAQVVALKAQGLSNREVGDRMRPKISSVRVAQILESERKKAVSAK